MNNKHADYEVVRVEDDRVFIVDLDLGNISVTNDAGYVFSEINRNFPNRRLIYRDTLGRWDEISLKKQSKALYNIEYLIYNGHVPDASEITKYPSSEILRNE
jgi:hypothetical protein